MQPTKNKEKMISIPGTECKIHVKIGFSVDTLVLDLKCKGKAPTRVTASSKSEYDIKYNLGKYFLKDLNISDEVISRIAHEIFVFVKSVKSSENHINETTTLKKGTERHASDSTKTYGTKSANGEKEGKKYTFNEEKSPVSKKNVLTEVSVPVIRTPFGDVVTIDALKLVAEAIVKQIYLPISSTKEKISKPTESATETAKTQSVSTSVISDELKQTISTIAQGVRLSIISADTMTNRVKLLEDKVVLLQQKVNSIDRDLQKLIDFLQKYIYLMSKGK